MDSSPDLSLKLRRGSSDSRDNFYMDFAQGIDSDIEEVDNSAIARDPQQPPTPPLPVVPTLDDGLANLNAAVVMSPPPMPSLQTQPLPTLTEADDLPPTPPPHLPLSSPTTVNTATTTDMPSSSPASPTTSVLEMVPPPPFSPNLDVNMRAHVHSHNRPLPQSPPSETEDEGDDADDADVDEQDDGDAGDDDDDEKSIQPPPLPPLPSHLSYVHGGGAHGAVSPPLTKSPSTSPSPPDTPPPCPKLSLEKIASPPVTHVSQIPPLTPPSESDQSQPNSPPPLPQHAMNTSISPPPSRSESAQSGEEMEEQVCPSTPPPEFGETSDMMAAVLIAAVETTSLELAHGMLQGALYQACDEIRSLNDDESTTITTPPSNGYSASSIIAPPAEHLGELEEDVGFMLADIPPPAGMEDEVDEQEEEPEVEEEEVSVEQKTLISESQPDEHKREDAAAGEANAAEEADEAADEVAPSTPTPQATPTISGSPKRRSGSIGTAGGGSVGSGSGSRAPSRSVSRSGSRSGSRKSTHSHGGSMRGSLGSRAGSIAAASVASVAASISSGAQTMPGAVISPQASIKSIRSPLSIKSPPLSISSKHSTPPSSKRSPPPIAAAATPMARMQSPPEGDSPPMMPSPPKIRSTPPQVKSPPPMHSPPKVTSPPRVYSPPLISSPPMRKQETEAVEPDKSDEFPQKSTGIDSLPSTSTVVVVSEPVTISAATVTAAAATTLLSYQDEHMVRPHLSSHHHYHLPHQFQHPHHQNHHTHSHGSVPVPTPMVPLSYAADARHKRAASSSGEPDDESSSSAAAVPLSRRSPPPITLVAPALPTTQLLLAADAAPHASISPAKSTSRLRDSSSHHRVTIDESNLPPDSNGGGSGAGGVGDGGSGPPTPSSSSALQLASMGDDRATGHLALMYHSHQLSNYPVLPAIRRTHRPSFVYPPMPRVKAGDALATLFSALYGKLLVVMGIAFPMAEVISTYIPPSFYEVYYLYLYIGSMIFLLFMYATLLWGRPKLPMNITSPSKSTAKTRSTSASDSMEESDTESNSTHNKHIPPVITSARRPSLLNPIGRQHHYGSFYLRMGAVAFGIGSMIYSGLEFGQYFELNPDTKCHNVLLALTPATRMAFIFIQMYFIFLNNEQIKVYRYKIIARFGLMHMIGTNLAVWLNVLIQETKHEILTFYNPENRTLRISHRIPMHSRGHSAHAGHAMVTADPTAHLRIPRGLKGPYQIFECRRTNILGTLVQDASPFLFPCTIEYSLICAAILYVMWRSISRPATPTPQRPDTISSPMKRSPHHYSVDCARAHKGLFVGILILVLTIISLILFFVLISRPDYVALAVTEVTICELLIYGTATIATLIGMIQMRHLQYDAFRSFSLDDILLVGAQTGTFLYNIFTVIAGHFTLRSDDMLVPINALASIVQTACQTMFILDAGRRQAVKPEHIRKKPGREIVTFMLVVNLAMWAISTLEKSRAESHPIQLNFYGLWAWTIITHVSMPLAIFYRFHSTVCLCEVWKRAYKLKPAYM